MKKEYAKQQQEVNINLNELDQTSSDLLDLSNGEHTGDKKKVIQGAKNLISQFQEVQNNSKRFSESKEDRLALLIECSKFLLRCSYFVKSNDFPEADILSLYNFVNQELVFTINDTPYKDIETFLSEITFTDDVKVGLPTLIGDEETNIVKSTPKIYFLHLLCVDETLRAIQNKQQDNQNYTNYDHVLLNRLLKIFENNNFNEIIDKERCKKAIDYQIKDLASEVKNLQKEQNNKMVDFIKKDLHSLQLLSFLPDSLWQEYKAKLLKIEEDITNKNKLRQKRNDIVTKMIYLDKQQNRLLDDQNVQSFQECKEFVQFAEKRNLFLPISFLNQYKALELRFNAGNDKKNYNTKKEELEKRLSTTAQSIKTKLNNSKYIPKKVELYGFTCLIRSAKKNGLNVDEILSYYKDLEKRTTLTKEEKQELDINRKPHNQNQIQQKKNNL